MKRALVFPGQASQFVGMGQDIFDKHPSVQAMYTTATEILGFDLAEVTFKGPLESLTKTKVTQPALFVTSAAIFSLFPKTIKFQATAGHSLGEYSALYAAGVLSFEDALAIVKVRAEEMHAAGKAQSGTMAAILNMSREDIERVCKHGSLRGIVQAANYNSPGQIVISGETVAVHYAMDIAKNMGARKVLHLNVSGAFHSPLMAPAKVKLSAIIEKTKFSKAKVPIIANVDAAPTSDPEKIKTNLLDQLESPVLWEDSVNFLLGDGYDNFIEIGPGRVLQGLIKRINRDVSVSGISTLEELEALS
ncbi:MAG: ACP S-malonyltransferase [Candidatus Marinimicrobia bacterium]|nr:ACP S-malonyltransferase [Candidatus Neomarinimicrobiota bacterium]